MSAPLSLTHEPGRIFGLNEAGRLVAEIDFPETAPGVSTITHTFVDDSLRGQGMAARLVQEALADIHAAGHRAEATCSYAVGYFAKHPDEVRA